jgi:hypothetical protein
MRPLSCVSATGHAAQSANFGLERILVLKPLDATERGYLRGSEQNWRQTVAGAPV